LIHLTIHRRKIEQQQAYSKLDRDTAKRKTKELEKFEYNRSMKKNQ
jgi:hypothetical protein